MEDLVRAKEVYVDGTYTCVVCKSEYLYTSELTGIKPMIDFLGKNLNLSGYSVADKIVGKAAALLFVYAGIEHVYADVVTQEALDIFNICGISIEYKTLTDKIINRKGDDICPMEKLVADVIDPDAAYILIREECKKLSNM